MRDEEYGIQPTPDDGLADESNARAALFADEGAPALDALSQDARSDWGFSLGRVIEAEIIPRLLLSHPSARGADEAMDRPDAPDVTAFTRLLMEPDGAAAVAYVERLTGQGLRLETLFLDVMAPAARQLGRLWETDHCDFVQVTIGLRRLQHMQAVLGDDWEPTVSGPRRRAMFLPCPGETHAFGIAIVETFFRAAGWDVRPGKAADYLQAVEAESFAVVGFSLSCERYLDDLRLAVERARRASRNPALVVLVGGPLFVERPRLARLVGADGTACDASHAVHLAQSLLERPLLV